MNFGVTVFLTVVIACLLAVDALVFGWDMSIFLGRRLIGLIEWLAFWR